MHPWLVKFHVHLVELSWLLILYIDLYHICQNMKQFGHGKGTVYGGCSEYTIVPAKYAYLLKTDIEDTKAAILERNFCFVCSLTYWLHWSVFP